MNLTPHLRALKDFAGPPPPDVRSATVQSIQGNTCTVAFDGDTTGVAGVQWLASYTPVVGDIVQVFTQPFRHGRDTWILDTLAPAVGQSQGTLAGTTAGTAIFAQPATSAQYKKIIVYLNGYENTTATAQTITYPVAFTTVTAITFAGVTGSTSSLTALTLPASMTAAVSGLILVEGY